LGLNKIILIDQIYFNIVINQLKINEISNTETKTLNVKLKKIIKIILH